MSLAGRYVGKQYTDNRKNEKYTVDPSFVVHGTCSWLLASVLPDVDCEMKLQVNNVFDVLYAAYGEGPDMFVGAERNAFFSLTIHL